MTDGRQLRRRADGSAEQRTVYIRLLQAGPGRVRQLRKEAARRGLDPNVWFGNVEQITSERIGRETVTYVSNIYKYYVAYRLVVEENQRRAAAKASMAGAAPK
jgi:membrane-bound lytic murein transglycosylase MltF